MRLKNVGERYLSYYVNTWSAKRIGNCHDRHFPLVGQHFRRSFFIIREKTGTHEHPREGASSDSRNLFRGMK